MDSGYYAAAAGLAAQTQALDLVAHNLANGFFQVLLPDGQTAYTRGQLSS